jgi:hypothetical protein
MKVQHVETQHYTQNDDTIDWFEIDGESWGLNKKSGKFRLIDCDGCPVDLPSADDQKKIDALVEHSEFFKPQAEKVAVELGLKEARNSYSYLWQNEITNDELIEKLQERSVGTFSGGEAEAELFVFSDGSCINRQGDEYFATDNVDTLDIDYLKSVGL